VGTPARTGDGGGAPAWLGGGGRADEHQRATGKLASGSVGAEEGRTGDLCGELGGGGSHGVRRVALQGRRSQCARRLALDGVPAARDGSGSGELGRRGGGAARAQAGGHGARTGGQRRGDGICASRGPRLGFWGVRERGEGEIEVGFIDDLSGGELHRRGDTCLGTDVETAMALAACRAEHSRGRVASVGEARASGFGRYRGRERWIWPGRGAWPTSGRRRRRKASSLRETEREMVVRVVL
jgi:hypothetical protein